MARIKASAYLKEYDDSGRSRKPTIRLNARLCTSNKPQIFEIELPDDRLTRMRSIHITRSQIERVLKANRIRK